MSNNICVIPPSPDLVNRLKEEYKKEKKKNKKLTEIEFFIKKGYFQNKIFGKDNNIINDPDEPVNRDIALMPLPRFKPRGDVNVLFLLVDFNDKPHNQTVDHFKKLLFSDGNSNFSQKSLKEYYREVSYGAVNVVGYVSDWIRMPRPYAYYVSKSKTWVHSDHTTNFAGIVYLKPNPPVNSGTIFFRHKALGLDYYPIDPELQKICNEDAQDMDKWEKTDVVTNVYNRLILFGSNRFHASDRAFGSTVEDSRLFQTFFFNVAE